MQWLVWPTCVPVDVSVCVTVTLEGTRAGAHKPGKCRGAHKHNPAGELLHGAARWDRDRPCTRHVLVLADIPTTLFYSLPIVPNPPVPMECLSRVNDERPGGGLYGGPTPLLVPRVRGLHCRNPSVSYSCRL